MTRASRLVLGTAQLGTTYGINNKIGKPSVETSLGILSRAHEHGVRFLDTADAYVDSHRLIGMFHRQSTQRFKIQTKLSELPSDPDASLARLCRELVCDKLDILYFHRFRAFQKTDDSLLVQLSGDPRINKLGVSAYANAEALAALRSPYIDVVQIPFNLLDNINHRKVVLDLAARLGKAVCTRSCFLQGVFFVRPSQLPTYLQGLQTHLETIHTIARLAGHSVASLALGYPLGFTDISQVIVGVDTTRQLALNIDNLARDIPPSIYQQISNIRVRELALLDPSRWSHE